MGKCLTGHPIVVEGCMSSPVSYDLQGQGGGVVIVGGGANNAVEGNFRWIQCLTDCVFDAISSQNINQESGLLGITIQAGSGIGGIFTGVSLNSGTAIVYYA